MRHGHVMGHKREKHNSGAWYRAQEEENIRQVEAQWGIPVPWHEREERPLRTPASPLLETPRVQR